MVLPFCDSIFLCLAHVTKRIGFCAVSRYSWICFDGFDFFANYFYSGCKSLQTVGIWIIGALRAIFHDSAICSNLEGWVNRVESVFEILTAIINRRVKEDRSIFPIINFFYIVGAHCWGLEITMFFDVKLSCKRLVIFYTDRPVEKLPTRYGHSIAEFCRICWGYRYVYSVITSSLKWTHFFFKQSKGYKVCCTSDTFRGPLYSLCTFWLE